MIAKLSIPFVFALASVGLLVAQEGPSNPGPTRTGATSLARSLTGASQTSNSQAAGFLAQQRNFRASEDAKRSLALRARIQKATANLKAAKDDDTRSAAEAELRKALGDDYDARLAEHKQHLDRMEKQIAEMRKKLARRRDAKDEMVDLRMKVVAAEAADLGWPGKVSRSRFPSLLRSNSGPASWLNDVTTPGELSNNNGTESK